MSDRNLGSALWSALSGLRTSQSSLGVVSENVANIQNPDYSRKVSSQAEVVTGRGGGGVEVTKVQRMVNQWLMESVRQQGASQSESQARMQALSSLSSLFGKPEELGSLGKEFTDLQKSLVAYLNAPEDTAADRQVVESLSSLADRLGGFSASVQSQRAAADKQIQTDVKHITELTHRISSLNGDLAMGEVASADVTDIEDAMDAAISELSKLIDIHVTRRPGGIIHIYTLSGTQLVGEEGATVTHDAASSLAAGSLYGRGGVGPILVNGQDITEDIKGGELRGLLDIRDSILPDIQSRLDLLADHLASRFNQAHNLGTSYPGRSDMVGSRRFMPEKGTGKYTQKVEFPQGDVFFILSGSKGESKISGSLLNDIMSAKFRADRKESVSDLAQDIQKFLRTNGAKNAVVDFEEGHMAIHLNEPGLHLSFYEAGTGDPADGLTPMTIRFNGADEVGHENDELIPGFSYFFGFNDVFEGRPDDSVYESGLVSKAFKTAQNSLITFYTSKEGIGQDGALPPLGLLIPAGSTLEDIADRINRNLEIYGHVHATIEKRGDQQRLVLEGDDGLVLSDQTLAPLFSTLHMHQSLSGISQNLRLTHDLNKDSGLFSRGEASYDSSKPLTSAFSLSRISRQIIDRFRQALQERVNWPSVGGIAVPHTNLGEYADSLSTSVIFQSYSEEKKFESKASLVQELKSRSDSIRGVNIDEEMSQMLMYQRAYSANARVISTIKSMLDTLMNVI